MRTRPTGYAPSLTQITLQQRSDGLWQASGHSGHGSKTIMVDMQRSPAAALAVIIGGGPSLPGQLKPYVSYHGPVITGGVRLQPSSPRPPVAATKPPTLTRPYVDVAPPTSQQLEALQGEQEGFFNLLLEQFNDPAQRANLKTEDLIALIAWLDGQIVAPPPPTGEHGNAIGDPNR